MFNKKNNEQKNKEMNNNIDNNLNINNNKNNNKKNFFLKMKKLEKENDSITEKKEDSDSMNTYNKNKEVINNKSEIENLNNIKDKKIIKKLLFNCKILMM